MKIVHFSIRTLSHMWNMVVTVSWFESVLEALDHDSLPSLMELNSAVKCPGKCLNWSSKDSEKQASLITKSQSPNFNSIEILWKDLKWGVHARKTISCSMRWKGPQFLQTALENWSKVSRNIYVQLLQINISLWVIFSKIVHKIMNKYIFHDESEYFDFLKFDFLYLILSCVKNESHFRSYFYSNAKNLKLHKLLTFQTNIIFSA